MLSSAPSFIEDEDESVSEENDRSSLSREELLTLINQKEEDAALAATLGRVWRLNV